MDEPVTANPPASPTRRRPARVTTGRRSGTGLGVRGLILGWCLWLLGSWIVLWTVGGWTIPALRAMVFASTLGLLGLWPAVRLSQMTRRYPATDQRGLPASGGEVTRREWARACRGTLLDWFCLNLVFQAVLWPLQIAARWPVMQTVWLALAVAGWSLLTGLVIAWGRGTDRGAWRAGAMVGCVALVVVEPALWCLGWMAGALGMPMMRLSPLQALWTLSAPGVIDERQAAAIVIGQAPQVLAVLVASATGWMVLGLLMSWSRQKQD